jgi:hypothetical protein
MVRIAWVDIQTLVRISHITMSMCNHSNNRTWQLHERVNYLILVGKVWTRGLRVIHFVMDDGQDFTGFDL